MSKELTDKWKNGELETGKYYYVKVGDTILDFNYSADHILDIKGWEVLAPVPDYDEYLALESDSLAKKEAEEQIAELEAKLAEAGAMYLTSEGENK